MCPTTITAETGSEQSDTISDKTMTSRENSIYSLPAELDSPEVGFKKLQQDGDLVDYDDISDLTESNYSDNYPINIQSYSRSVVRNRLIRLALNGPFQSPIDTDQKKQVLQVGCGNGDWCVDIAAYFPNWLVVGIDDKTGGPIQNHRKVPKNFKFIRCYYDLLRTMKDIPSDSFDLVYCRFLIFTYGTDKYNELINESYRICKPGGFVEFYELDMRIYGNPKAGPMTHRLNSKVFRSMEQYNLNPRLARKLGDMVSDQFNIPSQKPSSNDTNKTKQYKKEHFNTNYTSLPLGLWGGKLGVMFRDDINDLFENFELNQQESCPRHRVQLQRTDSSSSYNNEDDDENNILLPEEIEVMDNEMESKKSFMNLHHVYAQKNKVQDELSL
ncbi:hypothetical protein BDF21DRAFT_408785 [Thamnidium elegans]|nr:hypothetical protein BDF21DRAFT_408785 [Thamnidium elegans]